MANMEDAISLHIELAHSLSDHGQHHLALEHILIARRMFEKELKRDYSDIPPYPSEAIVRLVQDIWELGAQILEDLGREDEAALQVGRYAIGRQVCFFFFHLHVVLYSSHIY